MVAEEAAAGPIRGNSDNQIGVSAPSSADRSAPGPHMSGRTQPRQAALIRIGSLPIQRPVLGLGSLQTVSAPPPAAAACSAHPGAHLG